MGKSAELQGGVWARFVDWSEGMTAPRQVLPNGVYLITRRCFGRMFLLRPSEETNQVLLYIVAVAAKRYGIGVHSYCFLSNHLHAVVTDRNGNLPAFEQYLDSLVARALNALVGRWESFWAPGSYSAVSLSGAEDVLEKMAYVLANPVAGGLVRRGREWPGLWSGPEGIGAGPVKVKRPSHFFRPEGPMPAEEELELTCPPGCESVEELRRELGAAVEALEDQAARRLGEEGRSFVGARKVMAQRPTGRPAPVEPRRGLNPRVAARDKWKRIEALLRLGTFRSDYRVAWRRYARGLRDTIFPAGTYWMRVVHGVPCAAMS
jgi:putative transposase